MALSEGMGLFEQSGDMRNNSHTCPLLQDDLNSSPLKTLRDAQNASKPPVVLHVSVSLYEGYSSFTASLYPRIMGSTGSGRGNFIDKLAEPEGAKAPHGVGSHTRDIREHAVKLQEAAESMYTASLASGVWFSRGWTHRESLVPPTLVFYMQDWSLVLPCLQGFSNPQNRGSGLPANAMCYTGTFLLSQQTSLASHERNECT
ncbi:hypothetical protein EDD15DRAFT_2367120 [Pisolithus albus]|nr:hypothetical protein EDD15DRAFT_2367120 [Pisolithus albus]